MSDISDTVTQHAPPLKKPLFQTPGHGNIGQVPRSLEPSPWVGRSTCLRRITPPQNLNSAKPTIAEMIRDAGYTCGLEAFVSSVNSPVSLCS